MNTETGKLLAKMKMSKPKIIISVIATGIILLITALVVNYRSYLQEPDAYRQLREKAEASGLYDFPVKDPAILAKIEENYRIFSMEKGTLFYFHLSDLVSEIGPIEGGFQLDVNPNTGPSSSELNQKLEENILHKNKFEHYQRPPFTQYQDLHQRLDLLTNVIMFKEDVPTIRKWFLEFYLWSNNSDIIILAGYRALLQGDQDLARDCFYLLTDIQIHSIEEKKSWYALNHLYREYLWNSMEQGLLTDSELEELRQRFVRAYQEKPKLSEDTKRREQRSAELCILAELVTNDIRSGRMLRSSDEDMASDFLSKLFYYYRRPAAEYFMKEYFAMLDANDVQGIASSWLNLEGEFYYLDIGFRGVHATSKAYEGSVGIFPDEVIEVMPWVDRDRYRDARLLNCLALIEGYQYKRKQGHYPEGEILLTDIEDDFSKYKRFFFIEREGHIVEMNQGQMPLSMGKMGGQMGMGMGMGMGLMPIVTSELPLISISVPRRIYCLSTTIGNTVADESGKSGAYLSEVVFNPETISEYKDRAPYTGWWSWSFLNWEETKPIFQEVLIDYPKEEVEADKP